MPLITGNATLRYGSTGEREFLLTVEYEIIPRDRRTGQPEEIIVNSIEGRRMAWTDGRWDTFGPVIDFSELVSKDVIIEEILHDTLEQ